MATSKPAGKIGCLAAIALVLALLIVQAWGDYSWAGKITGPLVSQGWVVVDQQANYVDITRPWTAIIGPVVRVALIHPDSTIQAGDSLVIVNVLWYDHLDWNETISEVFPSIYNCNQHTNAFVDTTKTSLDEFEWIKNEHPVDLNIAAKLCD